MHTHTLTSTQSICRATSTEQVSLVMHHRALGSLHLRTEGKGGGWKNRERNKGQLEEREGTSVSRGMFASCWNLEALRGSVTQTRGNPNFVQSDTPVKLFSLNAPNFLAWERRFLYLLFWGWSKTSRWCIFGIHMRNVRKMGRKPDWGETKQKDMYLVKTMPLPPAESQLHST